ncbi:transcription factor TFIIE, alpha subunit [Wolffia australiana]
MAEPFNRLVKLAARAFYDDFTTKGENQTKTGRSDNRGMAVVVLDALTRRQWVREEDLAKSLKLHTKQLRRTLRFFEEEKLVTRDHRKETAKGAKVFSAAIAASADGQRVGKEGEEKTKLHTHSYCCLDYAQIYDVVRYRLHRMKKKLKDELDNRNTIQEYICPNCNRRYSAFDAMQLVSMEDEYFHCESCNGELVAESDKLAAEEMGDGDDNSRRRRREKLKDMLQRLEEQLKPLTLQLARVKDLPVPEFGTLQAWEATVSAANRGGNANGTNDASKSSQTHGYGGTPMPFIGETKVEVTISGTDAKDEGSEAEAAASSLKVLPPWMIKQGMNLTKEQRGEMSSEAKVDSLVDEKKKKQEPEDVKSIEEEYLTAYYEAYAKMLEASKKAENEAEISQPSESGSLNGASNTDSGRQVGMKFKREDDDDGGIEWDDESTGIASELFAANDTDAQDNGSGDEDDDIDWEEG